MRTKSHTVRRGSKDAAGGETPSSDQPGTPDAKEPKTAHGSKGGETPEIKSNEVEVDELKNVISGIVAGEIGKLQKSLEADGAKAAKPITKEDISNIVSDALKKHVEDGKKLDSDGITALVKGVVSGQIEGIRRDAKSIHNGGDASDRGAAGSKTPSGDVAMPVSWTKGNLPVHGKQLLNRLLNKPENDGILDTDLKKAQSVGQKMFDRAKHLGAKALTSTGSGTGDELVPDDLSSELQRRLYLESTLAQMMMGREIEMPTNPYTYPLSTTRPTFYVESTENTAATASTPGTGSLVLSAVKLMAQVDYSYEVDEDSIIPVLSEIQSLLAEAAAYALEDAIINGDADGTHQDSDTEAVSKHHAKAFNGLRRDALSVAGLKIDLSTGGISRANLLALKKALGKYGKRISDLAWIVGVSGENDLLGLDDVITVDKRGPAATTVTGSLASFLGIPIITSEAAREDLNASGVYDGVTTTKGSVILANLSRYRLGNRRGFTIETDRNIKAQTNEIVASFRKAFNRVETPSATITPVSIGYNYAA